MFKRHLGHGGLLLSVWLLPALLLGATLMEGVNLVGVSTNTIGTAKVIAETEKYLDVEWNWSGFTSSTVTTSRGDFQRLTLNIEQVVSRQGLGEPQLPIDVEMIRFPSGSHGRVEVLDSKWIAFENVRPYPVQTPIRDGDEEPPFAFDEQSFLSSSIIPEQVSGVTTPKGWGGVEVGSLWASPFRYTASTKQLEFATSMRVRVWFEQDNAFHAIKSASPSPWVTRSHQLYLLNPPLDPPVVDDADDPEPIRLLVVGKQEGIETAQHYINLRKNLGLRTEVWEVEDDVAPGTIKDRIREMYEEGLVYILFIGDGDEASPDIPMYWWNDDYPGVPLGDPDACGSDSWYTCLDGQDRDGYTDHLPDIALGRLVYDNVNALAQLQTQIDKLTDYLEWSFEEQNSEWLRRGLLMAHKQLDEDHDYVTCNRTIYESDYEFEHPVWDTLHGMWQNMTNARMVNIVNNGLGVFNYRGHGDERIWWHWNRSNEDVSSATSNQFQNRQQPFIVISSACSTGDIYDFAGACLMESFQKNTHGGSLCANGCTMTTITLGNSYADVAMFDALYEDGIYNIGYANNLATARTVLYFDANAPNNWRGIGYVNMRAYLWLGDAAIDYRLADPAPLAIEAPDLIPDQSQQLEVIVTSNGEPFANALVTGRTTNDIVHSIARTDAEGRATLLFETPLETQWNLMVTASEREAIPVFHSILVANGLGVIEGTAIKRSDRSPLQGVTVDLTEFHVVTVTDQEGRFRIEGIPSGSYELIASIRGMIPQRLDVNVIENAVAPVQFELSRSDMVIEVDEFIHEGLEVESELRVPVQYSNRGDAALEWTATFQPEAHYAPFEMITEFLPGWENEDSRIYGAVFAEGNFYVAGGNSNNDPNFIYVYTSEGFELVERRFEQESSGNGFRDLEWDGQFLYGAANDEIKVMTLEGDVVQTIVGPYNPSRALAVDPEGNIWVGNNRSAVVKINRQGNILQSVPVNFFVMGLAWYPDQPDGYDLLMWGREGNSGVELYGTNPETGRTVFLRNLLMFNNESAIEGLAVTHQYDSREWTLIGMVSSGADPVLRVWELDPRTDWVGISPMSGSLDAGEESEIVFTFDSHDYEAETILSGDFVVTTNNFEEEIRIPIELSVTPNSADSEMATSLPTEFTLTKVFPNPFNAMLNVEISLPAAGLAQVGLYDIQGRLVSPLQSTRLAAGNHSLTINGEGLANGLYLLRANLNGQAATAKVTLLK